MKKKKQHKDTESANRTDTDYSHDVHFTGTVWTDSLRLSSGSAESAERAIGRYLSTAEPKHLDSPTGIQLFALELVQAAFGTLLVDQYITQA